MRYVTVYFADGNTLGTMFNGLVSEIIEYYLGKTFELDERKPVVECVALAIEEP